MKHFSFTTLKILPFFLLLLKNDYCIAQDDIKLGVFYFDGWTGKTGHVTSALRYKFEERKPIWGWITSTQEIVEKQIELASSAGIDFFNFCWYYNPRNKDISADVKNQAMRLYRNASNKSKLGFAIMVANHQGYDINAKDWPKLVNYWISLMLDKSYVTVNDRPLLTFFTMKGLIKTFGDHQTVKDALTLLRQKAISKGLKGVSIAACDISNEQDSQIAIQCGFDVISAYNHHDYGLASLKSAVMPVSRMSVMEGRLWNAKTKITKLPQIPTVTLNWDDRPMLTRPGKYFSGFNGKSVCDAIYSCRQWVNNNPSFVTKEKIVFAYAWNEYGEGAWLTPSEKLGDSLIEGLKEGLRKK